MSLVWASIAQSAQRLATDWTVRELNPGGCDIFLTSPDLPWNPPSLLYNGYRVFPRGIAAGAWRLPPTPSNAEFKGRVDLYLYPPSGLIQGRALPLPFWHVVSVKNRRVYTVRCATMNLH